MKRMVLMLSIFILTCYASCVIAQDDCLVLVPRIGVTYTGSCRKGLANGQGEAIGLDHYIGEFKRGYPEGFGTYRWQTGETYVGEWQKGLRNGQGTYTYKYIDRDTTITGLWKDDKYVGLEEIKPYQIEYRSGIGRVSCFRTGDRPYVRYVFSRGNISNLIMQGSSGTENFITSFTGYDQVKFPFKGTLKFTAPNAWMTAMLICELRLTINQPGAWVVTISY